MGPSEGEPVLFAWPLHFHAVRLLLPLILLVLLFRVPNRAWSAWLLLPLALIPPMMIAWGLDRAGVGRYLPFLYEAADVFFFGLAFLWLLSDKLAFKSRPTALGKAAVLFSASAIAGLSVVFSSDSRLLHVVPTGLVYAALAVAALIALALAGVACRRRYTPLRFFFWFLLALVPGVGGVLALFAGLVMLLVDLAGGYGISGRYAYYHFQEYLLVGLIASSVLFLFMAPFLALAFWSPAFRPRFYAVFRLPGMQLTEGKAYNERSPDLCPDEDVPSTGDDG